MIAELAESLDRDRQFGSARMAEETLIGVSLENVWPTIGVRVMISGDGSLLGDGAGPGPGEESAGHRRCRLRPTGP